MNHVLPRFEGSTCQALWCSHEANQVNACIDSSKLLCGLRHRMLDGVGVFRIKREMCNVFHAVTFNGFRKIKYRDIHLLSKCLKD